MPRKKSVSRSASSESESSSIVGQAQGFLSESYAELKKVSTPTRQETTQATVVTIFMLLFVATCLFVLDMIFGRVMSAVLT